MLSPRSAAESLISGYIKENYHNPVPTDITNLIRLFYDKYFYYKIQKDELKKFLSGNSGESIHFGSCLTLNSIELECMISTRHTDNVVIIIKIKNMPSIIEYFTLSMEIGCPLFSVRSTRFCRWWKITHQGGITLGKVSDFQDLECLEFYVMADILNIKYKKNADKDDYKTDIKMIKTTEYEWKIDDKSVMEQMKKMHQGMYVSCDSFGNNNWTISVLPKGFNYGKLNGKFGVNVQCVRLPFGVSAMDTRYSIKLMTESVHGEVSDLERKLVFNERRKGIMIGNRMSLECPDVDIDELLDAGWILIKVKVEIVNIYNDEKELISKEEWAEFGVSDI